MLDVARVDRFVHRDESADREKSANRKEDPCENEHSDVFSSVRHFLHNITPFLIIDLYITDPLSDRHSGNGFYNSL